MNTIKIDSTQEEIKSSINNLLDQIDWQKIREVMLMLGWKWASFTHGDMRTPFVEELRETASRLIVHAVKDTTRSGMRSYQSTGGIVVRTELFVNQIMVEVSFEVDSADNYC